MFWEALSLSMEQAVIRVFIYFILDVNYQFVPGLIFVVVLVIFYFWPLCLRRVGSSAGTLRISALKP